MIHGWIMEVQMCPIFRFTQSPRCFCSIKALQECLNITKTHLCCQVFVKVICKKSLSQSLHLLCREISVCCSLVWFKIIKSDCLLYKLNTSYFIDLMYFNNKAVLWLSELLWSFNLQQWECVELCRWTSACAHFAPASLQISDHCYNIMRSVKNCQSRK